MENEIFIKIMLENLCSLILDYLQLDCLNEVSVAARGWVSKQAKLERMVSEI